MARNQELSVYLWDVSPSMHEHFPAVKQFIEEQMIQKLLLNPRDEIAFVLFGCDETRNDCNLDYGGYLNVALIHELQPMDLDAFPVLHQVKPGGANGDFLDALVVGADHIIRIIKEKNIKGTRKMYLITDAASPLTNPEPENQTTEQQADSLADNMEVQGIHVEAILVRPETAEKGNPFTETTIRNDFLLSRFCKRLKEEVRYAPRMEGLLNRIKHRVSPSTIYRNTIEVAPNLAIKVWVYKKTSQQNLPSLRMYSDRAPPGDSTATRAVKAEREYKLATDPDVVVPPDQQVKAYRYGPQIVPLSEVDRAALEFHADKGVKVLGFTLCENIPRHYYMSDVSLFIPDPNDPRAATAISALARALKASDKVAIVRCKFQERQGLGVTMGVLTPNLSLEDGVSDSFYFNVLPFAEDIREFTFASFDEMPPQTQPTKTQVAAMDQLVSTLDLAPAGIVAEAFLPDTTPNPILQRYYKAVYQRVVNPDLAVPELDESLRGIVEPDVKKLFPLGASKAVEHVEASFTLKEPTGKKAKSSKRFMVDRMEEARNAKADEEDGDENGDAALMESTGVSAITMDGAASQPPGSSIGRADPVGDFNAMLNRQDDDRWVPKAIQEMKAIIHDYLDSSYKGSTYSRAMECLTALRKGCIIQQEPRMFNEYLPTLQTKCKGRLDDFWDRIVANKLSLINKEEAPDSDVTEEQAEAFLSGRTIEAEVEGYDDLLDEI